MNCQTTITPFYREKSKQLTEQAAALVGLTVLGLDDGRNPDVQSPNDEVIRAWREEFQINREDDDSIFRHKSGNSIQNSCSCVSENGVRLSDSDSVQDSKDRVRGHKEPTESQTTAVNHNEQNCDDTLHDTSDIAETMSKDISTNNPPL